MAWLRTYNVSGSIRCGSNVEHLGQILGDLLDGEFAVGNESSGWATLDVSGSRGTFTSAGADLHQFQLNLPGDHGDRLEFVGELQERLSAVNFACDVTVHLDSINSMDEVDWESSSAPLAMLDQVRGKLSNRKVHLFKVGCQRMVWYYIEADADAEGFRRRMETEERFADGEASASELLDSYLGFDWGAAPHFSIDNPAAWANDTVRESALRLVPILAEDGSPPRRRQAAELVVRREQSHLLRDVVGNPFRPKSIDPEWLTWNDGTVARIARDIYANRDFDAMPILGDALQDAGCTDADILGHCRVGEPHTRGCWVVDLVLGKE